MSGITGISVFDITTQNKTMVIIFLNINNENFGNVLRQDKIRSKYTPKLSKSPNPPPSIATCTFPNLEKIPPPLPDPEIPV